MGNWIAREPWASLRYAPGYFRLAFQAGQLFRRCSPTNLTPTPPRRADDRRTSTYVAPVPPPARAPVADRNMRATDVSRGGKRHLR